MFDGMKSMGIGLIFFSHVVSNDYIHMKHGELLSRSI